MQSHKSESTVGQQENYKKVLKMLWNPPIKHVNNNLNSAIIWKQHAKHLPFLGTSTFTILE